MKQVKVCAIPECNYPSGECMNLCWHPDETRMDIIGQNGPDGAIYADPNYRPAIPNHDATRRPQSRFAAGAIPFQLVDDPALHKLDMVNHPPHYTQHPSGVECIQITEHMSFCLGNAVKYIWRADLKADAIEDLRKAVFYINREIEKREKEKQ